ncbi:MAG: metallophosphoesterase, partial [Planctomycetaceae bacterium]
VPGNFDPPEVAQAIGSYAVNLDETPRIINGWEFLGIGYSTSTGNNTPSEVPEARMADQINLMLSRTPPGKSVLVTHQPPYETLDMTPKGPAGSRALRAALDRVDVIICGHIHKQRGKIKDGAWVINPGFAAEGQAAVIDLDTMDIIWIDSVI